MRKTLSRIGSTALIIVGCMIGAITVSAAAGQYLKLQTSDGGSTFYVGRCFRTDIRVQTDTLDANSVDVIIPYNTSYLSPYTNSGCTVSATQVITDNLFPSYPYNSISGGRIEFTAFDPSGTNPVNTGANPADKVLAHMYWKVLAVSGSYKLPFDFTLTNTTDTNMAEDSGNGTDVLDGVETLTLNLSADSTAPTFTSISPANGGSNVSVTADLSYVFSDAGAGVNTGSLTTKVNNTAYTVTTSGCTTTNSNRIPSCNAAVTLPTLSYITLHRVSATGSDVASPTQNTGSTFWTFTTEDDDDAPYVENLNPAASATGVSPSSNIVMRIKDYKNNAGVTPGLGVDINSVEVSVTVNSITTVYQNGDPEFSYTGSGANYQVTINPGTDFPQNTTVDVDVEAADLHVPANVMSTFSYSFTTTDDTRPTLDTEEPARYTTSATLDDTISFHLKDDGDGVDLDSLQIVLIGTGTAITSSPWRLNSGSTIVSITGTSTDYLVTITLPAAIQSDTPYAIMVDVADLGGNDMDTVAYTFMNLVGTGGGGTNTCTDPAPDPGPTQSGGGRRPVKREVPLIKTSQLPTIIERRIVEQLNRRISERTLTPEEAANVTQCYVDEIIHGAAPKTPYIDIKAGDWYEDAVAWLIAQDALDTTQSLFRGGDSALRAEFAKLLLVISKQGVQLPEEPSFIDGPKDEWFYPYIEGAAQHGWMLGDDNCYGKKPCIDMPLKTTTRAEAVAMIVRYHELESNTMSPAFADIAPDAWYAGVIATAADHCIVQGDAMTGLAAPTRLVTRAEMATMLYRAEQKLSYGKDCGASPSASPLAGSLVSPPSKTTISSIGPSLSLLVGIIGCVIVLAHRAKILSERGKSRNGLHRPKKP